MYRSHFSMPSAVSISLLVLGAAGCDNGAISLLADGPEALDRYFDIELAAGGGPDGVVLEKYDLDTRKLWHAISPQWLFNPPDDAELRSYVSVYTTLVDPATGLATPLDLPVASGGWMVSDGKRIAWTNADDGAVYVYDTQTHATTPYALPAGAIPVVIAGDYLIAGVMGHENDDIQTGAVVLNVATSDQFTLEATEGSLGADTDGEWLAVERDLQPSSTIELTNLKTRDNQTIYSTEQAVWTRPVVSHGRVIWMEAGEESENSRHYTVRGYDIALGQTSVLLELTAGGDSHESTAPLGAGSTGVIMVHSTSSTGSNSAYESYELHTYDGQVRPLFEHETSVSSPAPYAFPMLAGDYIAYHNPDGDGWIIYNPVTQSQVECQPF